MMHDAPYPRTLADAFIEGLRRRLSADDLREAVARNRSETSAHACHTHDFCDANMIMLAAWTLVTGEPGFDPDDGVACAAWNAAWALAKADNFGARM